jgi:D-alanyl-D-alanine carboxypeptidase (penicillin-binding protein 5/6)
VRGAWLLAGLLATTQVFGGDAPPLGRIEAPAFFVVDHGSGRVLAERNATQSREPASLTKLMTAYVVFEELRKGTLKLTDKVRISHQAWRAPGSQTFLRERSLVPVSVLIQGMIVQSGNDAAIALAERIAGSERAFSDVMNATAQRLGMSATQFADATGLPRAGHVSSARDLAILASTILREYPEYYGWYSQRSFEWNDIKQWNRNHLLGHLEGVDGMKTGFTARAGYCIVASARRGDMRVMAVVLGAQTARERTRATHALLDYAFNNFETHRLYTAGEPVVRAEVARGTYSSVALGVSEDFFVTVHRGESARLQSAAEVTEHLAAPLAPSDAVGELRISLDGETLATRALHPLAAVEPGRWWNRLMNGGDAPQSAGGNARDDPANAPQAGPR